MDTNILMFHLKVTLIDVSLLLYFSDFARRFGLFELKLLSVIIGSYTFPSNLVSLSCCTTF